MDELKKKGKESVQVSDLSVPEDFNNQNLKKAEVSDKAQHEYNQRFEVDTMKDLKDTAFGRTLRGKNKTGRIIHSIIDVAPIPNVHEVIKAIINDAETENKALGVFDLLKETFQRLDYLRTGMGLGLVGLYIFDYLSLEKAMQVFDFLMGLV